MKRRTFLKASAVLSGTALITACFQPQSLATDVEPVVPQRRTSQIAFVKTRDRTAGVKQALAMLEQNTIHGKNLLLKPNFNSADPAPGSTHADTLSALVQSLQTLGAERITVGDRSGMGDTRSVMEQKGVFRMAGELDFDTLVFDELTADDWELQQVPRASWKQGFAVPQQLLKADGVVQTCCLKTHRYGGHFTLSLKNSVGLAAKWVPGESYNYMRELHASPNQRHMIAEINAVYQSDIIVLDGVEAFVDGGPARGKMVEADVILAGSDRVAIDAIGVALLRYFGTTQAVSEGAIFEQEQIARAAAYGLGVTRPEDIELVTADPDSAAYAKEIQEILLA